MQHFALAFEGRVYKSGKFWLAEIPRLDLLTQGRSKTEAYKMARSVIEDSIGIPGFKITIKKSDGNNFYAIASDQDIALAFLFRRLREQQGLTVREASRKLGSNSPNAYGVYEQGRSKPTLGKASELFDAMELTKPIIFKVG